MPKLLLGLIGPTDLLEQIISQFDPDKLNYIDYKFFIIQQVEDTKILDKNLLDQCDLLLFAGQIAYEIYRENNSVSTLGNDPVLIHTKYDGSALYKSLYEIAMETKGDLTSFTPFTIDVLNPKEIESSLKDVGFERNNYISIEGGSRLSTIEWADLHESFYKSGKSMFAVTCLTSVATELSTRNIPVKRVIPTASSINATLDVLYAKLETLFSNELLPTAIFIKWREPDRRPKNRYTFFRQRLKFQELIIDFCEHYQASLTFPTGNQANIFTSKLICESLTNAFKSFPFIKELETQTKNKIFVGIGIGTDTSKAEYYAEKALKFAESKKDSSVYTVFQNGNITGPLNNEDITPLIFSTSLDDDHLKEISNKTKFSAVTISRLLSLLQQNNNNKLTVHQLAEAFDISLRAASRILKQLNNNGLADIIGEEQPPGRGRPRKIYNITII